jgi:DNA adenine methylase
MIKHPARPFLKWAGGKSQLLKQFEAYFPGELKEGKIRHYFEPFLGGGAVFFHLAQKYAFESAWLSDISKSLMDTYRIVKQKPGALIKKLERLTRAYLPKKTGARKAFFLRKRAEYNRNGTLNALDRAAVTIFLNKTCYNGLFRFNSLGEFNAPHGRYVNPRIADQENLASVSKLLKRATLKTCSFEKVLAAVGALGNSARNAFVYLDPPYKPLSRTASFTAYSRFEFGLREQEKLAEIFRALDRAGAKVMLSNSDPKNLDPSDDFFDRLYKDFHISRKVLATRAINSNAQKRGRITELVITNF